VQSLFICFQQRLLPLLVLLQVSDPTLEEAIRGFRVIKNDTMELIFDKPGNYILPEPAVAAAADTAAATAEDEAAAAAAAVTSEAVEAVLAGAQV
jgi:hypothetical protein